jgi:oligopeptide transport system ATP-binding protein
VTDLKTQFFTQDGVVRAVDGVSFELAAGETLGIVGESGAGKSTLGRAVLRLIRATAGTVGWRGQDLLALDRAALRAERRHLQIVFQDPLASLDPRMTAGRIIAQPLATFEPDLSRREREERVVEAMRDVGLSPELGGRYPHELSGGQCQRVGIARAMILRPKLVVCDEPLSALDVSIQAQIVSLLRRLQAERGVALLFISHNLAVLRHLSHRVLVLYLGRVMEVAEREHFFARPLHPYSQALISAVPLPDPRRERARQRTLLPGDPPSPLDPPRGCRFVTRCPRATAICGRVEPPLIDHGGDHLAACHHA